MCLWDNWGLRGFICLEWCQAENYQHIVLENNPTYPTGSMVTYKWEIVYLNCTLIEQFLEAVFRLFKGQQVSEKV